MKTNNYLKQQRKKAIIETTVATTLAVLSGLLVGAILLWLAGFDPINAYSYMLRAVVSNFGDVVGRATPLIFTGLAVAIPYSVGNFNLGAEGQIIAGSFIAALVGIYLRGLSPILHIPLILLAAAATGGLIGSLIAYLKIRFNASETVVAIMLNSIILWLADYGVHYPFRVSAETPRTEYIMPSGIFPKFHPTDNYSSAIILALICAVLAWIFLNKTVAGYEAKATGFNPNTSFYNGINIKTMSILGMLIGGAFAGLGGAGEVMGLQHSYYHGFVADVGYAGVGVALIARKNPLAVVPAAFFFAAIRVGGITLDRMTNIPAYFVWVLQGTMIIFLAIPDVYRIVNRVKKSIAKMVDVGKKKDLPEEVV